MAPNGSTHESTLRSGARIHSAGVTRAARIALFVCFTALGAQLAVRLPASPVPVTLQTLFVVLAGITLGARDGCISMISYLALGAAGAPVFAGFTAGPLVLLGPTGGYLVTFPAAALLAGAIVGRFGRRPAAVFASSLAGSALILALGTLHLSTVLGLPPGSAVALGALPFAAGEALKAAAATAVVR